MVTKNNGHPYIYDAQYQILYLFQILQDGSTLILMVCKDIKQDNLLASFIIDLCPFYNNRTTKIILHYHKN